MDRFRIHLEGRGFSGRGVEYRVLDPDEQDEILESVSRDLTTSGRDLKDVSSLEFGRLIAVLGIAKMIVAITEPVPKDPPPAKPGEASIPPAGPRPVTLASAKWSKTTPAQFDKDAGGLKKFFTGRDIILLRKLYSEEHDIPREELDRILAGKVPIVD